MDESPLDIVDYASVEDAVVLTKTFLQAGCKLRCRAKQFADERVPRRCRNESSEPQRRRSGSSIQEDTRTASWARDHSACGGRGAYPRRPAGILLDAIVEVGVVQGEQKYATVRTLGRTSSYYYEQLPEHSVVEPGNPLLSTGWM